MNRSKACWGFTLVEMLVVVAILAALLGILLPALTRARAVADRSICTSNLQEIGQAIDSVSRSNGGFMPRARYLAAPIINMDPNPTLVVALIGHFRPVADLFHCPGDQQYLYQFCGISYFYHFTLSGRSVAGLDAGFLRWPTPAALPVLWDADNNSFPSVQGLVEVPRFHEMRVSLFADGHTDVLPDEQTPFY